MVRFINHILGISYVYAKDFRIKRLFFSFLLLSFFLLGHSQQISVKDGMSDGDTPDGYEFGYESSSAVYRNVAQSFTTSSSYDVTDVKLFIKDYLSDSPTAWVEIWSDNSGSPGSVITNGTSSSLSLSGVSSFTWKNFSFSIEPTLASSTTYWIVVRSTLDNDWYSCGFDSGDPITGNMKKCDFGGTWSNVDGDANIDMLFEIYGNPYCDASGSLTYETSLTNVTFNTINNSTAKVAAYNDYTSTSTTVNKGSSYNLSANVNTDGGSYTVHAIAWIDWNRDGDFADSGEEFDLGSATGVSDGATSASPYSVTVPTSASTGSTRMRVAARYSSDPTACGTSYDGEVEDYTINIQSTDVFYSKSTGNLNLTSSWGTNTDGTGTNPSNFTAADKTYYIANRTSATIGAAWTVSGTDSKVVLGDASSAGITFSDGGYAFTGTIDLADASSGSNTLKIESTTIPTFGTINSSSTVDYASTSAQTITATTYGNLKCTAASGNKTFAGNTTVSGTFTISGANTVILNNTTTARTFNFANITMSNGVLNTGTADVTGDLTATVNISGNFNKTGGTTDNTSTAGYAIFNFNGGGSQTFDLNSGTSNAYKEIRTVVKNSSTLTLNTDLVSTGTDDWLTVESGSTLDAATYQLSTTQASTSIDVSGTLKTANTNGFSGSASTTISSDNSPTITLGASSTIEYNGASTQTISARTDYANIIINNSAGVSVTGAVTLSGTLTLTDGVITNTSTLTVDNTATAAISGYSSARYIKGSLNRKLSASVSSDGTSYVFPVADASGNYRPFELVNIRTGATTPVMKVNVSASGASTYDGTMNSVNARNWYLETVSGDFTSSTIKITESSLGGLSVIGYSSAQSGDYTNEGGNSIGATITSDAGQVPGYFAIGEEPCTPPGTQASALGFASVDDVSMTVSWTRGNGNSVLVIARAGSAPTDPATGVTYTANAAYGSGDACGGGYVIYNGTGTSVSLTNLTASTTYYFAVYEYATTGTCYNLTQLTGSQATNAASCDDPSALSASNVDDVSADLGWTENGTATTWEVEYGADGYTQGTGTSLGETSSNPKSTGSVLTPNTAYDFYVRAKCGVGDYSNWVGPFSFTTECSTISSFPFNEGFEDDSENRDCWTQIQETGTKSWTYATGAGGGSISTAHGGTENARFTGSSGGPYVTKLVSPVIDFSNTTNQKLSFWYGQEVWVSDQNELKIYYRTSSGGSWTLINTYSSSISTWTQVTNVTLPSTNSTYQIAFEGIDNFGYANVIDDVQITADISTDSDSDIDDPTTQVAAGNISSLSTALGSAVEVFKCKIEDLSTADTWPTKVTTLKITKNAGTADLTDNIASAALFVDGTQITATPTINDSYISFAITEGNFNVDDGTTDEVTMKVWLNSTGIVDGATMQFAIPATSHGCVASSNGSEFAADFGTAVTGNTMTIAVVATQLAFVQQPSNSCIGTNMSPSVTVHACDANGNRDTGFSSNISLTASGTVLTTNPYTVAASSGLATFASVDFTATASNATLTAERTASSDWDVTSNAFDVSEGPEDAPVIDTHSNTNSSVTWEWLAVTGATGYDVNLDDAGWTDNGSDITETKSSLNPNQEYCLKIRGKNTCVSDQVTESCFYTSANVPSAPTVNNATISTLDVIVNENSNPASTTFAIYCNEESLFVQADGSLGASEVWQTDADWGTTTVTGLTANTSYSFKVKAKNGNGDETAYSSNGTESTLDYTFTVGTGTEIILTYPFYNYYENNRSQMLYLQSELGSAKDITDIYFNIQRAATSYRDFVSFSIKFKHTSTTAFGTAFEDMTGATTVYSNNPEAMPSSTGWCQFSLSSSFSYNGTDNLIIEVLWGDNGGYTTTDDAYTVYGTDYGGVNYYSVYGYDDSVNPPAYDGRSTERPNVKFDWEPSVDSDSKVEAPASQVAATEINSVANDAVGEALSVFKFKITDLSTADTEVTDVTTVKINKVAGTADLTDHIAGAVLNDGTSDITVSNTSITDDAITFTIASGNLEVADGGSEELTLKVWLNTSNVVDNATMQFGVAQTSHGFVADASGSGFASDFGGAVTGNTITVDVDATAGLFVANKPPANVGVNAIFPVEVQAVDANDNQDVDFTGEVTLALNTGTGSLSSSAGLVQSMVAGEYEWNDVRYNTAETFSLKLIYSGSDVATSININAGSAPGSFTITAPDGSTACSGNVDIEWTASSNATSYDIYWCEGEDCIPNTAITGQSSGYTFSASDDDTEYNFRVKAKNSYGETWSNTTSYTTYGGWVWNGSSSTVWALGANWCGSAIPGLGNDVLIPAGASNTATLTANQSVNDITIESGATLNLGTYTLYIYGDFVNNGTVSGTGKVVMYSTANQTLDCGSGGIISADLEINKSSGTVSLSNNRLKVGGDITIESGALSSNGQNIELSGNWLNKATFTAGSDTVIFYGGGTSTITRSPSSTLTLYSEDFSSGTASGWVLGSASNHTEWRVISGGQSDNCLGTVDINAEPDVEKSYYKIADRSYNTYVTASKVIDLTEYSEASLSMYYMIDGASEYTYSGSIKANGIDLTTARHSTSEVSWTQGTYSLNSYCGGVVTISFIMNLVYQGDGTGGDPGFLIDDIEITGKTNAESFAHIKNNKSGTLQLSSSNISLTGNVEIISGATLNANGNRIKIKGDIVNNGTISESGTIELNGSSNQSVSGSEDITFNDLYINSSGNITFGDATTADVTYTVNGDFDWNNANNNIVIGNGQTANLIINDDFTIWEGCAVDFQNSSVLSIEGKYINFGTLTYNTGTIKFHGTDDSHILREPALVIFYEDFESGTTGWTLGSNAAATEWKRLTGGAHNSNYDCAVIDNEIGVPYDYYWSPASSGYVDLSKTVDLTGYNLVELQFYYRIAGEPGADYGQVLIDNTVIMDNLVATPEYTWSGRIDLSSYAGSSVTLKFRFNYNTSGGNSPGFCVDDILMTTNSINTETVYNIEIDKTGTTTYMSSPMIIKNNVELSSGTFDAAGQDFPVGGNWNNTGGTFLHNDITRVTFDGAGTSKSQIINTGGSPFYNITVNNSGGNVSLFGTKLEVDNNFTLTDGTFNVSDQDIDMGGHFLINGGSFNSQSQTINFIGDADQNLKSNANSLNNIVVNKSGSLSLLDDLTMKADLTLTGGTFDVTSSNRTITIGGNWYNNGGSFSKQQGTVVFNGTGTQQVNLKLNLDVNPLSFSFYNVTIDGADVRLNYDSDNLNLILNNMLINSGKVVKLVDH